MLPIAAFKIVKNKLENWKARDLATLSRSGMDRPKYFKNFNFSNWREEK